MADSQLIWLVEQQRGEAVQKTIVLTTIGGRIEKVYQIYTIPDMGRIEFQSKRKGLPLRDTYIDYVMNVIEAHQKLEPPPREAWRIQQISLEDALDIVQEIKIRDAHQRAHELFNHLVRMVWRSGRRIKVCS